MGLVLLGFLGVSALLMSLWLERRIEIALPKPTGQFAVGRTLYDWVDDQTLDPLAPAGTKRELLVWVWYPAAVPSSVKIAEYVPDATRQGRTRSWSAAQIANKRSFEGSDAKPSRC